MGISITPFNQQEKHTRRQADCNLDSINYFHGACLDCSLLVCLPSGIFHIISNTPIFYPWLDFHNPGIRSLSWNRSFGFKHCPLVHYEDIRACICCCCNFYDYFTMVAHLCFLSNSYRHRYSAFTNILLISK